MNPSAAITVCFTICGTHKSAQKMTEMFNFLNKKFSAKNDVALMRAF